MLKFKTLALPIGILTVVAAIATVLVITFAGKKEDVYRVVKINHFEGEVTVLRDEKMNAFEGLQLISEDTVETGESSKAELLADSDKHILAEENTKFVLKATGTEKSGNITINLLYGTSLIEIENKLSEESYFEVTTPNATLSVRGTTFEVNYDEETETTSVEVIEGVVAVTSEDKTEELTAGKTAVVTADEIVVEDKSEDEEKSEEEPKGPRTEREDNEDGTYYIREYDADNILIKSSLYKSDDTLESYHIYERDSDGNKIKTSFYYADGTFKYYWTYEYDSDGNEIKSSRYKDDGTLDFYRTYEYDSDGNKIKESYYKDDGTLNYYYTLEYDSDGNKIKTSFYYADGTLDWYYIYEYDSNGNKIKESRYNEYGTLESSQTF